MDSPLRNYLVVDHNHGQIIAESLEISLVGDVHFMERVVGIRVGIAEVFEDPCNVSLGPLTEVATYSRNHLDVNVS